MPKPAVPAAYRKTSWTEPGVTPTSLRSVHDRALAWQGFGPQVSVVNEVRKTDARLHDHERTGGEPGFARLF